jgi:hypothetical protein
MTARINISLNNKTRQSRRVLEISIFTTLVLLLTILISALLNPLSYKLPSVAENETSVFIKISKNNHKILQKITSQIQPARNGINLLQYIEDSSAFGLHLESGQVVGISTFKNRKWNTIDTNENAILTNYTNIRPNLHQSIIISNNTIYPVKITKSNIRIQHRIPSSSTNLIQNASSNLITSTQTILNNSNQAIPWQALNSVLITNFNNKIDLQFNYTPKQPDHDLFLLRLMSSNLTTSLNSRNQNREIIRTDNLKIEERNLTESKITNSGNSRIITNTNENTATFISNSSITPTNTTFTRYCSNNSHSIIDSSTIKSALAQTGRLTPELLQLIGFISNLEISNTHIYICFAVDKLWKY